MQLKDKDSMVETYVYGDIILLENLIMNYLILWSTAKLTRYSFSRIQLFIAALLGALYALFSYFPNYSYMYTFFVKILFSIAIVIIAYTPLYFHLLLKLTAVFYIVSFIFGGAAFGLFYFINGLELTSNGISFIRDFPIKVLLVASIIAYFAVRYSWDYIQHRIKRERILVRLEIYLDRKKVNMDALVDTGNSLKDPVTDVPVIIAEYEAISELLPGEIRQIFEKNLENDLNAIAEIMSVSSSITRFRLIPFKSLGRENGMLIGFKPDTVILRDNEREIKLGNTVIGIYRRRLSRDGEYYALVHPDVFKSS